MLFRCLAPSIDPIWWMVFPRGEVAFSFSAQHPHSRTSSGRPAAFTLPVHEHPQRGTVSPVAMFLQWSQPALEFFQTLSKALQQQNLPTPTFDSIQLSFWGPMAPSSHRLATRQTTLGQQLYKRHVSGDKNRWAIIDSSIHRSNSRKSSLNRSRQRHEIPSPGSEKDGDVTWCNCNQEIPIRHWRKLYGNVATVAHQGDMH